MNAPRPTVLLTGVSGYIGGNVLFFLSEHDYFKAHATLYCLVRQESQAVQVRQWGFNALVCDLNDTTKLREQIEHLGVTIVLHSASSSVLSQQSAMLDGIAAAQVKTGLDGFFITIAGSDAFANTGGWDTSRRVSDLEDCFAKISALPTKSKRQLIDLDLHTKATTLGIYSWTIYTPTVYGKGRGFGHQFSINVPGLVRAAARERKARYTNRDNLQPVVHVDDISRLWILLTDKVLSGEATKIPHGLSGGAYFAEVGSVTWKTFGDCIGAAMYAKGLVDHPQSEQWPSLEVASEALHCPLSWAGTVYGANTNWVGEKAKTIGWDPQHDLDHFLSHMDEEVDTILAEKEAKEIERIDLH